MRKLISVVLSHQVRGNWLRRPQEVAAGKQAASRPRKDAGGGGPAEGTREGAAGTRTPHLGRLSIQLPSPISITQASTHGPAQARAPPKGGIRPPAAAQPAVRAFPARTPPLRRETSHGGPQPSLRAVGRGAVWTPGWWCHLQPTLALPITVASGGLPRAAGASEPRKRPPPSRVPARGPRRCYTFPWAWPTTGEGS